MSGIIASPNYRIFYKEETVEFGQEIENTANAVGKERGHFQIGDLVASGSHSSVFKVQFAFTRKEYVLKVPKLKEHNESISQEIKILSLLNAKEGSEGIVEKIGAYFLGQKVVLALEFLSKDLKALIHETNGLGLSFEKTRSLMKQLFQTLHVLKQAEVIHGDIKPGNIAFVDGKIDCMKLIDFEGAFLKHTPLSKSMRTSKYRSPERVIHSKALGYGIDMWSSAVTITTAYLGRDFLSGTSSSSELSFLHESRFREKYPRKLVESLEQERVEFWENTPIDETRTSFDDLMNRAANGKSENSNLKVNFLKTVLRKMFKFDPEERISPEEGKDLFSLDGNMSEAAV